jgi:putative membrane protein
VIVRPRPHWFRLLFVRRGSLVHRIYGQQLFIFALSCAVVFAHRKLFLWKVPLNASPFSLMGVAFAIFLGFRINASYNSTGRRASSEAVCWWSPRNLGPA